MEKIIPIENGFLRIEVDPQASAAWGCWCSCRIRVFLCSPSEGEDCRLIDEWGCSDYGE